VALGRLINFIAHQIADIQVRNREKKIADPVCV